MCFVRLSPPAPLFDRVCSSRTSEKPFSCSHRTARWVHRGGTLTRRTSRLDLRQPAATRLDSCADVDASTGAAERLGSTPTIKSAFAPCQLSLDRRAFSSWPTHLALALNSRALSLRPTPCSTDAELSADLRPNDQVHRAGANSLDESRAPVAPAPVQPLVRSQGVISAVGCSGRRCVACTPRRPRRQFVGRASRRDHSR